MLLSHVLLMGQLHLNSGEHMMGDSVDCPADGVLRIDVSIKGGAGRSLQLVGAQGVLFEQSIMQEEEVLKITINVDNKSYLYSRLVSSDSDNKGVAVSQIHCI